jgi:hypothetical protein
VVTVQFISRFVIYPTNCWRCRKGYLLYYCSAPVVNGAWASPLLFERMQSYQWVERSEVTMPWRHETSPFGWFGKSKPDLAPTVVRAVAKLVQDKERGLPLAVVKERYSRTVGESYLSFGCPRCDALYGEWFRHSAQIAWAWYDGADGGEVDEQLIAAYLIGQAPGDADVWGNRD